MVIQIPGVDVDKGLGLCEGDLDIYVRFLHRYVANMPESLSKMRNVSEATLKDYTISAHGVKGISEIIGASDIIKEARQLEVMAKEGNLAGVLAQNDAFIKHAENVVAGIQSWLEKHDASGK